MKRLLILTCLLLPLFALADDPSSSDLLETAFARIDTNDERFQPYSFIYEIHSFIRAGDDELEEEYFERGRIRAFSPDSTETEVLEERTIFGGEDESEEEAAAEVKVGDGEESEGEDEGQGPPKLDAEFREKHEFRFDEWTELDGRRAAVYKIRPRKKKKNEYWKGQVWFAPEKGELLAYDLEPAKKRFGMRSMRMRRKYADFLDRDLPARMNIDVEVKVPLIIHKKINMEMRFSDFVLF